MGLAKCWNRGLIEFRSIRYAGLYTRVLEGSICLLGESVLFFFSRSSLIN